MGINSNTSNEGVTRRLVKLVSMIMIVTVLYAVFGAVHASAAVTSLDKPKLIAEATYESSATHPYNAQTNSIIVRWNKVKNAQKYYVYIKGGKYSGYKRIKTTTATSFKVTGLQRGTEYSFIIRAVAGSVQSKNSAAQKIRTALIDYDQAGYEAICRIVYHEVGRINDDMWDRPIVYVADCVANRFVAAKYLNDPLWAPYYRNYYDIQSIIYRSGGFMSDYGLTRDGCDYGYVPQKVKLAVWGATYAQPSYKGIENDYTVFYWCNTGYYQSSYKIAYSFRIPWGYFSIWREFWG